MSFNEAQMLADIKAVFDSSPATTLISSAGIAAAVADNHSDYSPPTVSRVQARRSTTQAISNGAYNTIVFLTEEADVLNEYNNATGIFAADAAGDYLVSWRTGSENAAWTVGEVWESSLSKNNLTADGSAWRGQRWAAHATATVQAYSGGAVLVTLAAADTLRVKVYQNQGGPVNTLPHGSFNYFHVRRIS